MSDSRVHTGREVMPEGTMSLRVGTELTEALGGSPATSAGVAFGL